MPDLYELRIYESKPDQLQPLVERWQTHYREIFSDHCEVLGCYVSRPADAPEPTGVALLLAYEDEAEVDRAFAATKADPRMETAPGPTGEALVAGWQRIFLRPIEQPAEAPAVPLPRRLAQ